uniref:Ig-like domain-containing protein n=1 Tax=Amphilophus citrinellus TaxID=61819 RepID=A0A3Q0RXL5_AMPCI
MEKFVAVFAVLAALLAANVSVSEAQPEKKYFKAGGDLQLSPQKVSVSIFSIVWKYDKNLLAEWVKDSIELTYYSKFRGRSELNIVTGELVVHNMTSADKGVYSVEINNQVQSLTYQTVEIQEVPKPTVEFQPLVCDPDTETCRLICYGDIANAGPVSYFWKKDDGEWEPSGDRKELTLPVTLRRISGGWMDVPVFLRWTCLAHFYSLNL